MKVLLIIVLYLTTFLACIYFAKKECNKVNARHFKQMKKAVKEALDEWFHSDDPFADLFEEDDLDSKRKQTERDLDDLEYTLKKEMTKRIL